MTGPQTDPRPGAGLPCARPVVARHHCATQPLMRREGASSM
jgi:hypothetical protein